MVKIVDRGKLSAIYSAEPSAGSRTSDEPHNYCCVDAQIVLLDVHGNVKWKFVLPPLSSLPLTLSVAHSSLWLAPSPP